MPRKRTANTAHDARSPTAKEKLAIEGVVGYLPLAKGVADKKSGVAHVALDVGAVFV